MISLLFVTFYGGYCSTWRTNHKNTNTCFILLWRLCICRWNYYCFAKFVEGHNIIAELSHVVSTMCSTVVGNCFTGFSVFSKSKRCIVFCTTQWWSVSCQVLNSGALILKRVFSPIRHPNWLRLCRSTKLLQVLLNQVGQDHCNYWVPEEGLKWTETFFTIK